MAVGKKETIHVDLVSVSEVGPMGVPGMSGKPSSKFTKFSKSDKVTKGGSKSQPGDRPRRNPGKGPGPNLNNLVVFNPGGPKPGGVQAVKKKP